MSKYVTNYNKLAKKFLDCVETRIDLVEGISDIEDKTLLEVFKILVNREYFEYVDIVLNLINSRGLSVNNDKYIKYYLTYVDYMGEKNQAYLFWDSIDNTEKERLLSVMKTHNLFDKTLATIEEYELIAIWRFIN